LAGLLGIPLAVEERDRLKVFHAAAEKVRLITYKNMRFDGMMNRRPGSLYGLSVLAEEKYRGLTSIVMLALSVATRASNKATNLSTEQRLQRIWFLEFYGQRIISEQRFTRRMLFITFLFTKKMWMNL
jgi:hypothetical protein